MKANQVVILTPVSKKQKENKNNGETPEQEEIYNESEKLRDAKTIFIYNVIKKKNPIVNVVSELVDQDNIAYLLDNPEL